MIEVTALENDFKKNYDKGLQLLEDQQQVPAMAAFKANYEKLKNLEFTISDQEFQKLIPFTSLSLKKIGWICRQNQEFEKAYYYHEIRYEYVKKYGSKQELHDACISLDMDSFYLKDLRLCQLWLHKSLEIAKLINNPIDQTKALGISYNNLSGTYSEMKLYKEALESIDLSLDHWIKYESYCGTEENRIVWAYYAVAEIFFKWSETLQSHGEHSHWQKQEALKNYSKSLQIAQSRNMPDSELHPITIKIHQLSPDTTLNN